VKTRAEREWYIHQTIASGWSRNVLGIQIERNLYRRQGKALTNFADTLPATQSDLALQLVKDPYTFDFLTLSSAAHERDLERALLNHLRQFLLELGKGFAFIGSQHPIKVCGEEYRIDLLFYNFRLHCFVVIDLKMEAFRPEHAGKMNFYLSAVDDLLRHPDDQRSIGIILCRERNNKVLVEYALRDTRKPIGVSEFRLCEALPEDWQGTLPTVEELEAQFSIVPQRGDRIEAHRRRSGKESSGGRKQQQCGDSAESGRIARPDPVPKALEAPRQQKGHRPPNRKARSRKP
jgi:predicted nuclease of restriction endonuclease-like (RecB) superfamily